MRPVYLAGPIQGCTDEEAKGWREAATALLDGNVLDPMVRDYRGREAMHAAEIVEGDMVDLQRCSAVLAYCPRPSVGTSMEVLLAWQMRRPVFAVVPAGAPVSPWLAYHSSAVVPTVADAVALVGRA